MDNNTREKQIKGKFTFYPAGQGGFYAGGVYIDDRMELSMVYDCGTFSRKNSIEKSINEFHDELFKYNKHLNILVISHLDGDHVNKLEHLLKDINKIDLIIMPYISRISAIWHTVKYAGNKFAKQEDFYRSFIIDPIATIKQFTEVRKFIFIYTDMSDNNDDIIEESYEEYGLLIKGTKCRLSDEKLNKVFWKYDRNEVYFFKEKLDITMLNIDENIWIFKFWENEIQYRKNVLGFFKELKSKNINVSSVQNIRQALIYNQKELRDAYNKFSFSINDTSIILYHSPVNAEIYYGWVCLSDDLINHINDCFCKKYACGKVSKDTPIGIVGTLLTGDINLKVNYSELVKQFEKEINNLFIVTLPHHGSKYNWCDEFYKDNSAWLYVIQAGFPSRFSHPSYDVICALNKYNKKFCIVNEFKKVTYTIENRRHYKGLNSFVRCKECDWCINNKNSDVLYF